MTQTATLTSGKKTKKGSTFRVTLGLADGKKHVGELHGFSPQQLDLRFQLDGEPAARLVPGEKVAYVAFHKVPGQPPPPRREIERMRVRIHATGGQVFDVTVEPASLKRPPGFSALPEKEDGEFERFFFYSHGVNAKENPAPLGQLLVENGALNPKNLEDVLSIQKKQRDAPLGSILVEKHQVSPEAINQAVELQRRKPLRLGELLVEAGWLSEEQLTEALGEQKKRRGRRLGEVLVDLGLITEAVLTTTLANKFLIPMVDLEKIEIDPQAAYSIPKEIIAKHKVLPIRANDRVLTLAICDPLAVDAIEEVRMQAGRRVEEVMTTPSQLKKLVTEYLARLEAEAMEHGMEQLLEEIEAQEKIEQAQIKSKKEEVDESDSTVIRLVNRIIIDAYQRGASDIHIEPQGAQDKVRVRLRRDGVCETYQEIPAALRRAIVARVKIMSRLDISERRKPQDGKIKFDTRGGGIELRVATLPTLEGDEDVVMRILASSQPLPPRRMGYSKSNLERLTDISQRPYGLILVVGPTGSGKTTTLHSVLGSINLPQKKIWTAEDPVEITQKGLRQVQVQPKIGLNFAMVLRAFLRADPDVIMIGEMRDYETAHIGIEASLTGHLVLSTLHTNSAPETIVRLMDMGLDPFSFADALLGVLAQRLTRAICPKCKVSGAATREEYDALRNAYGPEEFDENIGLAPQDMILWSSPGCEHCRMSGYKGRLALHELLTTTPTLKSAIGQKARADEIRTLAKAGGMRTLLQDGIEKVLEGRTDFSQVLAVCQ